MLFIALLFGVANAETLKVAVLDTGIAESSKVKVCPKGKVSFVDDNPVDTHGHGTNISWLINDGLENTDYCQVVIKVYKEGADVLGASVQAFMMIDADPAIKVVNISMAGLEHNTQEKLLIQKLLKKGVKIVTAVGNQSKNLDSACIYYPACYNDEVIVVGNGVNEKAQDGSNYGSVVDSFIDGHAKGPEGHQMTGSSQSAAIYTNQLIKEMINDKR